jgi:glycosyltransferase involved in cell wall biosynthesis
MGEARMLVLPSEWYEVLPRVVIEAFARGTPILAAKLGATAELVEDGRTGLHFRPGDPQDLAARVDWLLTHSGELRRMRDEARAEYLAKYTAERNYELLMGIYARAVGQMTTRRIPVK